MTTWEVRGKGFFEDGLDEFHELTTDNLDEVLEMVRTYVRA